MSRYCRLVTVHATHGDVHCVVNTRREAIALRQRIGMNGVTAVTVSTVRRLNAECFTSPTQRVVTLPFETSADAVAKTLADGMTGAELLCLLSEYQITEQVEPMVIE